jgi:hypothetical protein
MGTDASERGMETLILRRLTGRNGRAAVPVRVADRLPAFREAEGDT